MRHQVKIKKFGRVRKVRQGLLKSLAVALIDKGNIKTTEAKAKELSKIIEPYITRARNSDVASRRLLAKKLPPKTVKKLFDEVAPRYIKRSGGYTRITKLKERKGDGAAMANIELV